MGVCSFACFLRLCYNNLLSANTGHTRKTCTRDQHQGKHHLQTGYCGAYPEPYTQKHLQNHYKPSSLWARLPCHHTRPTTNRTRLIRYDQLFALGKQDHVLLLMNITSSTGQISSSRSCGTKRMAHLEPPWNPTLSPASQTDCLQTLSSGRLGSSFPPPPLCRSRSCGPCCRTHCPDRSRFVMHNHNMYRPTGKPSKTSRWR